MAHNLAESRYGGKSFVSVRQPAWHGLGIISEENLTIARAITLAGLDYEVGKMPNFAHFPDGRILQHEDSFFTFRTDTNEILGSHVGGRYEVVQNSRAFSYMEDIVGNKQALVQTAGALGKGERAWMLLGLPDILTIGDDEVLPYFIMLNSHDGSGAIRIYTTATRVVCQNTLNMSLRGVKREFKIKHTVNVDGKVEEAKQYFGFVRKYYEHFQKQANTLLSESFSKMQYEGLCRELLPKPKDEVTSRVMNTWEEKFKSLVGSINAPDLANVNSTKWGAFNAVADYSDHYNKGLHGSDDEKLQTLFTRSFENTDLKDKALEILIEA